MTALRAQQRFVIAAAAAVALVVLPSTALAAETASVSGGVVNYTSGAGTVDTVTVSNGSGGSVVVAETTSPSGSLGSGCTTLSSTSASCTGATSINIQTLDLDDSIVNTSSRGGTLDAGLGNDTVTGGTPVETILGGDGSDTINPGGGVDIVNAGPGDDQLDTRDGLAESIDCGDGADTILFDEADVLTNCEVPAATVITDPVDEPAPTTTATKTETPADAPATAPAADAPISAPKLLKAVTLVGPIEAAVTEGAEVTVSGKGVAPFVLACTADAGAACAGSVFIDPAPVAKKSKKARGKAKNASVRAFMARRGRYGRSAFKITPGSEDTVDVKLSGMALKALGKPRGRKARSARRGRRVRAVVTIAPRKSRAQRVTITLKG